MKKIVGKNQIIVTALAIMIVVAGYLNFTGQEITTSGLVSSQNKEQAATKGPEKKEDPKKAEEKKGAGDSVETSTDSKEDKKAKTDISAEDEGKDDYKVNDNGEVVASEESPGEAVMVSNSLSSDYFSSAKLSREQSRAKNKETLMEIINNKSLASADKKAAVKEVAQLTEAAELENAAELMLEAKGFSESVVSISQGNADVVVNAEELSSQQIAQIEDIVKRKTGIAAQNIVITPVKVEDK
ncbi:SpoIIIAH-like family protein [bacterium 1xD8-6]|nr:SpoIIIAH-like family protein [bacterium D16-36]RKI73186.1 SpoIIIAH-like family protein [bacterium 1xD8-6]